MKVLGLIPARGGSKGIPKKNLKILNGKPLLSYTIEAALKSDLLEEVVLSSDDPEIMELGKSLGASVPFKRPDELATDESPSIDTVIHALQFLSEQGKQFDAVCLLQPTTPFRTVDLIDSAIRKFEASELDSLVSVRQVPHHFNPHWVYQADDNNLLRSVIKNKKVVSRRQNLPPAYYRDGMIYLTRTGIVLNDQSLYGDKIGFIESAEENYINLDTLQDWKEAERILKNNSENFH